MPNEKEIKAILDKAKKVAESKKLDKKVDKSKTPPTTKEPSSEVVNVQLLNTVKELQRTVVTLQKNQETFNNTLQSLVSKNSPSTEKTSDKSETEENNKNQKEEEKLTSEEKLARAQEEQARQQGQMTPEEAAVRLRQSVNQVQQMQRQGGKITGGQIVYLIGEGIKAATAIIPAALGGKGGGAGAGVTSMIENFKTFGELSKVFSNIQSNIAKGYSDSLKAMTPSVREEMADRMLKGGSVPETSPSEEGHIR